MIKPDIETLNALVGIQQYPEWTTIVKWLDQSLVRSLELTATMESDAGVRWYQGRTQELLDIKRHIDGAREAVRRYQDER